MIRIMKKDREVQFKLRLPEPLLAVITECAERSGRSIGAEINSVLEEAYGYISNMVIRNRHSELALVEMQTAQCRGTIEFLEKELQATDHTPEHRAEGERLLAERRKELAQLLRSRVEIQRQLEWASDGATF